MLRVELAAWRGGLHYPRQLLPSKQTANIVSLNFDSPILDSEIFNGRKYKPVAIASDKIHKFFNFSKWRQMFSITTKKWIWPNICVYRAAVGLLWQFVAILAGVAPLGRQPYFDGCCSLESGWRCLAGQTGLPGPAPRPAAAQSTRPPALPQQVCPAVLISVWTRQVVRPAVLVLALRRAL